MSPISRNILNTSSKGMVFPVALLLLLILTFPGATMLYLSFSEVVVSKNTELDAVAFYRAETGVKWALYWFNNPSKFNGPPGNFFYPKEQGNTSYIDENGISQYQGTPGVPHIIIAREDFILQVSAPFTPGAICSVKSIGIAGRIKRTIRAELFDNNGIIRLLPGSWRMD